ncbi:MAG: AAA family ATPase [Desulfomonilaceae bacterium]|nr:AAA family ATPase [Desulfomonilaceae bacterium]
MQTDSNARSRGEILAVTGKGGTGKTTTTAIMAKLLVQQGVRPLVVDADPPVSLAYALGAEPTKTLGLFRKKLIEDPREKRRIADSERHMREFIYDEVLMEVGGASLLVLGRAEGPGCFCGINELLKFGIQSLSDKYAITLIDCEAGIEQINRLVVNRLTTLLIVSDASVKGIRTAEHLSRVAGEYAVDGTFRVGLVINKAGMDIHPLEKRAEEIGLEIVGLIPEDENVAEFDLLGTPTTALPDDSPCVNAVRGIMERLKLIDPVG